MANDVGMLVMGFITVIVGLVLIGSLADSIFENNNLSGASNESITISSLAGTTTNADVVGVDFFGNATNSTDDVDITVGSQVNFTKATGAIAVSGDFFADGVYNITYTYEGANYLVNGTARSLMSLNIIFFAIAILAVGMLIMRQALVNMGML